MPELPETPPEIPRAAARRDTPRRSRAPGAGADAPDTDRDALSDLVDEAGRDSFPASDPPAYNMGGTRAAAPDPGRTRRR